MKETTWEETLLREQAEQCAMRRKAAAYDRLLAACEVYIAYQDRPGKVGDPADALNDARQLAACIDGIREAVAKAR